MYRVLFMLIVSLLTFSTSYSQFIKITDDPIVSNASESRGVAWGDYNNDGFDDLFVNVTTVFGGNPTTNQLFKNNGDGTFSNITDLVLIEDGVGRNATWGDYDNDGYLDLYVTNSGLNYLYRNLGNETFEKITTGDIVDGTDIGASNSSAWGDYNHDGYLDLFVTNYGSNNFLFTNNQNGTFTKETELSPVNDNANSNSASWIDYNNDGSLDLMVSNYYENDLLYANDGLGMLELVENSGLTSTPNETVGASWADFDNDGDFDVFVTNNVNRADQFFVNNGDGTFTEVFNAVTDADIMANSSAWGDFDNDGLIDLAIASTTGNYVFRNTGAGFENVSTEWGITDVTYAQSVTTVDYDRDGFLDLYFANLEEGVLSNENLLYKNTENGNNWINIKLTGTISNNSAIGSNIRLKTVEGWQKRTIQSQTGNKAQSSLNAHFGLASSASVDTILVEWPLKGYQEFINTNSNQFLEITEIDFPTKPTNLNVAYIESSSANLTWSDNSDTEIGFRVERSTDSINFAVVAETDANSVEYMDINLTNGTKYYYRVSAMTDGGFSYYTQVVDVFIKDFQMIEFDPINDLSILDTELTLTTTNSSNLDVLFLVSGGEDKVSIENNIVTLLDTGRVEIGAYSLGTDLYLDSDTIYQSFQILRNEQILEFEPINDLSIIESELTLTVTNSSNLDVLYLISEGEDKVSIENNIVTLLDTGRVEIGAYSLETDIYLASDTVYQSFSIFDESFLAINEEQQKFIKAYPVPFTKALTISIPESILNEKRDIHVSTLEGKSVYTQFLKRELTKVDLSHLPSGIYIIRIDNWSKRVIKTDSKNR
ncbi:FG-GAP-like repeat-containing protein [Marivirga sp.]|uniref:FG-GAP-like repeat-containing protein n=1 Tax=Marivirga sp. TaxID=2018662 RepID=UPI002D7FAC4C|nr:FG-GAP-like repeat-containing protein [Marivirga sp.]HET8860119.1 FG-GAP-like repeat-containing protein [Marivirga sp.]